MHTLQKLGSIILFIALAPGCASVARAPAATGGDTPSVFSDHASACPDGAELAGVPPPIGSEQYCRKTGGDGVFVKHGRDTVWYPNGQKAQEGNYKDGQKDGHWLGWHENGQKLEEADFRDGQRFGRWTLWLPNGQKKFEGEYADDKMEGVNVEYYDSGEKFKEIEYHHGLKHGRGVIFYRNGVKQAETEFKDDVMNGRETVFYEDGIKRKEALHPGGEVTYFDRAGRKIAGAAAPAGPATP